MGADYHIVSEDSEEELNCDGSSNHESIMSPAIINLLLCPSMWMKSSSSAHALCLRSKHVSDDFQEPSISIEDLKRQLESIQTVVKGKGKKRQAASDFDSSDRPRKLCKDDESSQKDIHLIDILSHAFHFHFSFPNDAEPSHDKDTHHTILDDLGRDEVDFGQVDFESRGQSSQIFALFRGSQDMRIPMPTLHFDDTLGDTGIDSSAFDLLQAAIALSKYQCAELRGTCKLVPASTESTPFRLEIELQVSLSSPAILNPYPPSSVRELQARESAQRRVLDYVVPPFDASTSSDAANIAYFYSILQPAPPISSQLILDAMQPEELLTPLLPFQRRTVAWLLDREGIAVNEDGHLSRKETSCEYSFWRELTIGNETWYRHILTGQLSPTLPTEAPKLGAILAEEPGLGKTLETIALILLNPAPESSLMVKSYDEAAKVTVTSVKSTLIVTPPALAAQWYDELCTHAPALKVLVYDGWTKVKVPVTEAQIEEERAKKSQAASKTSARKKATSEDSSTPHPDEGTTAEVADWCTYCNSFDVVLTTYTTLRTDLYVARAAPDRPRRQDVKYTTHRIRSPLIMVEFARVVMDEVQMAGGTQIEDMVSLIPRRSSIAVSGTPAKSQVSDLQHVLKFLRVDHLLSPVRYWARLQMPGFRPLFADFFRHFAVRTMKSHVESELTIPQQTRYLVSIEMGPVERHVYDRCLEQGLVEIGLDYRGVAATSGWEVDGTILRSLVGRLRSLCTHPQIGQLATKNDKIFKQGALKSMADVLQNLLDQNWRNFMDDWKAKIQAIIRRAQLLGKDADEPKRYQLSLRELERAEKEIQVVLQDIDVQIAEHELVGDAIKQAASGDNEAEEESLPEETTLEGKERRMPKTPEGEEWTNKRRALTQRVRESKLVLHRIKFLMGDVFHMLGPAHILKEDAAYEMAEQLRRSILGATEKEAQDGMKQLSLDIKKKGISAAEMKIQTPPMEYCGARSSTQESELEDLVDVMNEQADLLWKWRTHIIKLLTSSLSSSGDEATDGNEYQRNLDNQGEAETYLQAYTALLADRREAVSSERTTLAVHDSKEAKQRATRAAQKAQEKEEKIRAAEDVDIQPQHEVIFAQLREQRKDLLLDLDSRSLKTILVRLSNILTAIHKDSDPEKILLNEEVPKLRALVRDQGNMISTLEADLALMRKAFNQRILYFRQLQEISDSVVDVDLEEPIQTLINRCENEEKDLDAKVATGRARQRYLVHLSKKGGENKEKSDEDEDICILCRYEFVRGFVTACAHIFCEPCLRAWLARNEGKACPVCRSPVDIERLQRFTTEKSSDPPPSSLTLANGEPVPVSHRQINYNMIDPAVFQRIEAMESFGDYGNKIQTLIRHLLYIQQAEPGAKSIVFSAWADSLTILQRALTENNIGCLRIDNGSRGGGPVKAFARDRAISVLLLHGERENAGLNITCASRVFLLESVVHHGFEVQAIARIDRMGQKKATEVFCYYAEDTVEKNILDLAARKRLSLYTKDKAVGMLNVGTFAADLEKKPTEAPKKKQEQRQKGDFISKIDDLLAILFPHMYEDVEYLIQQEDVVMQDSTEPNGCDVHVNAVAGPSRL